MVLNFSPSPQLMKAGLQVFKRDKALENDTTPYGGVSSVFELSTRQEGSTTFADTKNTQDLIISSSFPVGHSITTSENHDTESFSFTTESGLSLTSGVSPRITSTFTEETDKRISSSLQSEDVSKTKSIISSISISSVDSAVENSHSSSLTKSMGSFSSEETDSVGLTATFTSSKKPSDVSSKRSTASILVSDDGKSSTVPMKTKTVVSSPSVTESKSHASSDESTGKTTTTSTRPVPSSSDISTGRKRSSTTRKSDRDHSGVITITTTEPPSTYSEKIQKQSSTKKDTVNNSESHSTSKEKDSGSTKSHSTANRQHSPSVTKTTSDAVAATSTSGEQASSKKAVSSSTSDETSALIKKKTTLTTKTTRHLSSRSHGVSSEESTETSLTTKTRHKTEEEEAEKSKTDKKQHHSTSKTVIVVTSGKEEKTFTSIIDEVESSTIHKATKKTLVTKTTRKHTVTNSDDTVETETAYVDVTRTNTPAHSVATTKTIKSTHSATASGSLNVPGDDKSNSPPTTSTLVGSIIGSVAGIAVIVIFLFVIFAHYKKRRKPALTSSSSSGHIAAINEEDDDGDDEGYLYHESKAGSFPRKLMVMLGLLRHKKGLPDTAASIPTSEPRAEMKESIFGANCQHHYQNDPALQPRSFYRQPRTRQNHSHQASTSSSTTNVQGSIPRTSSNNTFETDSTYDDTIYSDNPYFDDADSNYSNPFGSVRTGLASRCETVMEEDNDNNHPYIHSSPYLSSSNEVRSRFTETGSL